MAPGTCLTLAVTPSEPLAPVPVVHGTSLPEPIVQASGAAAARYSVKTCVVPEPSDRCATWMPRPGATVLYCLIHSWSMGATNVEPAPARVALSLAPAGAGPVAFLAVPEFESEPQAAARIARQRMSGRARNARGVMAIDPTGGG